MFSNVVVEMAREQGAGAIVQPLRAISDFEYEFEYQPAEPEAGAHIELVYIIASPNYSFLSSTGVKEMATHLVLHVSDLVRHMAQRLWPMPKSVSPMVRVVDELELDGEIEAVGQLFPAAPRKLSRTSMDVLVL